MAENMGIYFDVLSPSTAQITLYNKGSKSIVKGKWGIYVCVLGVIDYDHLANNPKGYVPPGKSNLKMTHIGGCLYKLEPLNRFKPFASGEYIKIRFNTTSFLRARSDLAPNWYVAAEGLKPRTIVNTAGEDLSFVFTSQKLTWDPFSAKIVPDLRHAPHLVIPTPKKVVITEKARKLTLGPDWKVYGEEGLENEVKLLAGITGFVFCCVVLCCVVLCCVVLLCFVVLFCVALLCCVVVLCRVVLYFIVLFCVILLCCVVLCSQV